MQRSEKQRASPPAIVTIDLTIDSDDDDDGDNDDGRTDCILNTCHRITTTAAPALLPHSPEPEPVPVPVPAPEIAIVSPITVGNGRRSRRSRRHERANSGNSDAANAETDILRQRRNFMALVHESRIRHRPLPHGLTPPPELPSARDNDGNHNDDKSKMSIRQQMRNIRRKWGEKWRKNGRHSRRIRTLRDLEEEADLTAATAQTRSDQMIGKSVLNLTNQYRERYNLTSLQWAPRLADIALEHSRNMAQRGRLSHDGFAERVMRFPHSTAAENVACNNDFSDPASIAVNGWIQSPGHRQNMISPRFTFIVGIYSFSFYGQ